MKQLRILTFALALGMAVFSPARFGVPIPEVGQPAHAYAPCDYGYWVMQDAWDVYIRVGGFLAYQDFLAALQDYHHCMAG